MTVQCGYRDHRQLVAERHRCDDRCVLASGFFSRGRVYGSVGWAWRILWVFTDSAFFVVFVGFAACAF